MLARRYYLWIQKNAERIFLKIPTGKIQNNMSPAALIEYTALQSKTHEDLMALKPMVGTVVKMKVALSMSCTPRTIETYLDGEGKKLPFAISLLANLKKELENNEPTGGE